MPERYEQVVIECSEQCPGECIFVEDDLPEPLVAAVGPGVRGSLG